VIRHCTVIANNRLEFTVEYTQTRDYYKCQIWIYIAYSRKNQPNSQDDSIAPSLHRHSFIHFISLNTGYKQNNTKIQVLKVFRGTERQWH